MELAAPTYENEVEPSVVINIEAPEKATALANDVIEPAAAIAIDAAQAVKLDEVAARSGIREVINNIQAARETRLGLIARAKPVGSDIKVTEKSEEMLQNATFTVAWYGEPIGQLSDTNEFTYDKSWLDVNQKLSLEKISLGGSPKFLDGLFGELDLYEIYKSKKITNPLLKKSFTIESERYLANISIVRNVERLKELPFDALDGKLIDFSTASGIFNGEINEIPRLSKRQLTNNAEKAPENDEPKVGGIQSKILCNLDQNGNLRSAVNRAFTHIVKLSGGSSRDPDSMLASIEWASMSLAKGGGVKTCEFSLLEIPGSPPAFICERFDIPKNAKDNTKIFIEDLMSVYSNNPPFKANATLDSKNKLVPQSNALDSLTRGYMQNATANKQDQEQLFKRIYANYLLENGDFHLKNTSLIREKINGSNDFTSTRLAPAYDISNTKYLEKAKKSQNSREKMLLDYKGKVCDFGVHDFIEIGKNLNIDATRSMALMNETSLGIAKTGRLLLGNIPKSIQEQPNGKLVIEDLIHRAVHFSDQAQLAIKIHNQNSAVAGHLIGHAINKTTPVKSKAFKLV